MTDEPANAPNSLESDPDEPVKDEQEEHEDHDEGESVVPPDKLTNDAEDNGD